MKGKRPANNARKVLEWIKRETNRQQTVPFCPWGGEIDGLTLDNTCTVDCHLYMIHLILIDEQFKAVKEWLHSQCKENPVASVLLRVSKLFEKKKWAEGKLIWIRETNPEAIDSEMGNVNLFGSEYDFFVGHYSTLQESVTENVCSNDNCPERGIERKYTEIVLHDSDTRTIQGAIDEWQNNSMDMVRCREKDPVSKRSCKGYRNWTRRRFTNSNIPKLVIANIENIKGEVSVGEEVVINDIRYSVYAITFGNGSHFIAVFNKNGSQQVYDGLKTSVEPLNILPARFSHVHVLLVMKVTD
ncbi:uncharacterized protein C14orf28 homolog [Mercenaria mercenaria]|uniref:uncharacterized protein C14orf28 homolog n=1 Tax=Mercenaria mercenaria TaxID=6596 RepID=UPI001E1D98CB|nr:uncharacterized protein C14orf28 homolog [Mercenaria mercenaria]